MDEKTEHTIIAGVNRTLIFLHPDSYMSMLIYKYDARYRLSMLSVIIPAKDEQDFLPLCIQSIRISARNCSIPVQIVVVVDLDSTDGTYEIACKLADRVVTAKASGKSTQQKILNLRFAGVLACQYDLIASTDADTLVDTYWTSEITSTLMYKGCDLIFGPFLSIAPSTSLILIDLMMWRTKKQTPTGANLAFRKTSYFDNRGWEHNERKFFGSHSILENFREGKATVCRCAKAIVYTDTPESFLHKRSGNNPIIAPLQFLKLIGADIDNAELSAKFMSRRFNEDMVGPNKSISFAKGLLRLETPLSRCLAAQFFVNAVGLAGPSKLAKQFNDFENRV